MSQFSRQCGLNSNHPTEEELKEQFIPNNPPLSKNGRFQVIAPCPNRAISDTARRGNQQLSALLRSTIRQVCRFGLFRGVAASVGVWAVSARGLPRPCATRPLRRVMLRQNRNSDSALPSRSRRPRRCGGKEKAGEVWQEVTGSEYQDVVIDEDGNANFKMEPEKISIWIRKS